MRTVEPVVISSIFARIAQDGSYTYSARIYQNILRYSMVLKKDLSEDNNRSFTLWEITKWLTANKDGNIDKSNKQRIEYPQKTIKNKLQNLVQLKLLRITGSRPITKGTRTTTTYQFTEFGDLLALIIESFEPIESMPSQEFIYICDEIFKVLCTVFSAEEGSTSTVIFYSNFFKKCKEKGVFVFIVTLFRDTLAHNTRPIAEMTDLFQRVFMFGFRNNGLRNYFNKLFDETIHGLDFKTKKLVLYDLKLNIERKMRESVLDYDGFEKVRYQVRGCADIVALEGHCSICDHYISVGIALLDYRKSDKHPILGTNTGKCPKCGIDSLKIADVL